MSTRLVLATHNPGKVVEFQRIAGLEVPDLEVVGYDGPEPQETGLTFVENAFIKARAAAARTGLPALADDSGICVDSLGGMPGVFSAYWAGHAKDAVANRRLLLDQLADIVEPERRRARFVAVVALVIPGGIEEHAVGEWPGTLALHEAGTGGFGYDPVFISDDGEGRTAAQLTADEKAARSHRRRAFDALIPLLHARLGVGAEHSTSKMGRGEAE